MKRKRAWTIALAALACMLLAGSGWLAYAYYFPFGHSHCCDKAMYFALQAYALQNKGRFPSGEKSPEASLSLLYPEYADVYLLKGKTIRDEDAIRAMESDGRLGPDTCSWHYVENLTTRNDGRFALFWDKEPGLGHNGQRLSDGSRMVFFVNGTMNSIPLAQWDEFLKEQKALWDAKKAEKRDY